VCVKNQQRVDIDKVRHLVRRRAAKGRTLKLCLETEWKRKPAAFADRKRASPPRGAR